MQATVTRLTAGEQCSGFLIESETEYQILTRHGWHLKYVAVTSDYAYCGAIVGLFS